jgi:23S rRNA pseudouridine1911/1915/1917 synthase
MTRNGGYAFRERIQQDGERLLDRLVRRFPHAGADRWQARIAAGEVLLDGRPAEPEAPLCAGAEVVWHRPPWDEPEADVRFRVLYEDDLLVAVAKPRGLPTLPGGGYLETTLVAQVRARYPDARPMHRLGRETSGLVLFARTREAAAAVQEAWRGHRVEKGYRALGQGVAGPDAQIVTAPIGPVPHPRLGTVQAASPLGKPARSRLQVLHRGDRDTLFEVWIETGRPHQVRIHLAYAGHPLVGDPLYGPGGVPLADHPGLPGDGGYFLHAEHLRFRHPGSGAPMDLWAPPPAELLLPGE